MLLATESRFGLTFLRGGLLTGFCESRFTTAAGRVTQPAEMPDHPSSDEVSASDEKSMTLMMRHTLHARMGLGSPGWMDGVRDSGSVVKAGLTVSGLAVCSLPFS